MLQAEQVSAETIRSNATRLLTDSHFKDEAKHIGETFRSAGGMSRAVDEIEALLQKQVTQPKHL